MGHGIYERGGLSRELKPLPVAPTVSTWTHADLEHFWQDIMIRSGVITVLTSWDESPRGNTS